MGIGPEYPPSGFADAVYQSMTDGVVVLDAEDVIVDCNPAMGILAGRPMQAIIGRRPAELWGSATGISLTRLTPTTDEVTILRPDGDRRQTSVKSFSVFGEGGQVFRVSIYRDITRLRRCEMRQREMDHTLRLLMDSLDDGVLIIRNGQVLVANRAFARMAGFGRHAALNPEDVPSLFAAGDFDLLHPPGDGSDRARVEVTLRTLQGRNVTLEACVSALEFAGKPAVLCTLRDITARRRADRVAAATARMAQKIVGSRCERSVGLALLEAADEIFGWDAAFIDLFPSDVDRRRMPDQNLVIPLLYFDIVNGKRQEVVPLPHFLPPGFHAARAAEQGAQLILRKPAARSNPPAHDPFGDKTRPSASLMFAPIRAVSGVIGVVSVQSYRFDAYTEFDLDTLEDLAAHCGSAIEHWRNDIMLRMFESAMRLSNDMVTITAPDPASETGTSLIFVNDAFLRETGYTREEVIGRSTLFLQGPETDRAVLKAMHEHLVAGRATTVELVNYRKDGTKYDAEISAYPVSGPGGDMTFYVSIQRVITGRKREREELAFAALHDLLTQLPNRALFRNRVERALARSRRYAEPLAVIYLDLDNFKLINDSFGHQAGDEVLREVALRLTAAVRPCDTVARYGGDEFTILVEEIGGIKDVKGVAERIMGQLRSQFHVAGMSVSQTASMGIAMISGDDENFDQILARADEALLAAKAWGKNFYHVSRSRANLPTEGL